MTIRQIQMMRNRRMRLRVLAMQLKRRQMSKDHRTGMRVLRPLALLRRHRRRVETPLQEMYVRRRALRVAAKAVGSLCDVAGAVLSGGSWEGQDELWVFECGGVDASVGHERDDGAEGFGVRGEAEAPDVFDFAGGEGVQFGQVQVGGEGFDAGFGDGVG